MLSPAGDAVFYVDDGGGWVVPLLRVPRQAFEQARLAARRATVLSNGKQLGLALLMYSQDYDDTLPGAERSVGDLVMPYMKNNDLLEGFVYTFAGGKLSDITEPSKMVIGYVLGPGGRANIRADGSVAWEPDAR
jgi:hypothetical protein